MLNQNAQTNDAKYAALPMVAVSREVIDTVTMSRGEFERLMRAFADATHALRLSAQKPAEQLVRYCPGCGSIGPVEAKYRDCCPDGNEARQIPLALAEKCRATFKMAIELMIEAKQTTPEARAAAGGKAH